MFQYSRRTIPQINPPSSRPNRRHAQLKGVRSSKWRPLGTCRACASQSTSAVHSHRGCRRPKRRRLGLEAEGDVGVGGAGAAHTATIPSRSVTATAARTWLHAENLHARLRDVDVRPSVRDVDAKLRCRPVHHIRQAPAAQAERSLEDVTAPGERCPVVGTTRAAASFCWECRSGSFAASRG